jgi:hypothetical protein
MRTAAAKPVVTSVGRIYEDRLSTAELRVLVEAAGADEPAGTADEVLEHLKRRIDEIADRNNRT